MPQAGARLPRAPQGAAISPSTTTTHTVAVITRGELAPTRGGREARYAPGDRYDIQPNKPPAAGFDVPTDEVEIWLIADST